MKKIIPLIFLFSFPASAIISPTECVKTRNSVGMDMYTEMINDFKIDRSSVDMGKTKAEITSIFPVNRNLAVFYGEKERRLSGKNSEDHTTADEYANGFMADNAKNIIVKYTFEDKLRRKNILLASAFVSDVDCAVRFNGYIIIKREF